MTKYRPPVPHTPPPTSLRGANLRNSVEAVAALRLRWYARDSKGIIHIIGGPNVDITDPKKMIALEYWTECNAEPPFEDTLAEPTCLWCMAGRDQR